MSKVVLERNSCAAGEAAAGRVAGRPAADRVALVRAEHCPHGVRRFVVAETTVARLDSRFALTVPRLSLPTAAGPGCSVAYGVCTAAGDHAALVVSASARPHLPGRGWETDRLVAQWEARHFHLELVDADLRGGGTLSGRVHRHDHCPAGAIDVTARCLECWRTSRLGQWPPDWHERDLWETEQRVDPDPDATWAPFCFELPAALPPAVEGRTIAWRYELWGRRRRRHWFSETAALTPLLYEECRTTPPGPPLQPQGE